MGERTHIDAPSIADRKLNGQKRIPARSVCTEIKKLRKDQTPPCMETQEYSEELSPFWATYRRH